MFIGQYNNKLDAKNRLTFPAKFRENIDGSIFVTRGLDGCLNVYTKDQWDIILAKLTKLPSTKKNVRDYTRIFLSNAIEAEFDKSGRINIPNHLIACAKLEKSCIIVGTGSHIEIWDETVWNDYNASIAADFEDIAVDLVDFEL